MRRSFSAGPSSNDEGWIRQVYELGRKGSFDMVATHPYQDIADAPPECPDDGRRWWFTHFACGPSGHVAERDGDEPIWFTEFDWSGHPTADAPNWLRGVTSDQHGDYLVRAIDYTKKNYPYLQIDVLVHKERANPSGTNAAEEGYALLGSDL